MVLINRVCVRPHVHEDGFCYFSPATFVSRTWLLLFSFLFFFLTAAQRADLTNSRQSIPVTRHWYGKHVFRTREIPDGNEPSAYWLRGE